MSTTIKVRKDGVSMHYHPTDQNSEGRWHGPWERHPRDLGAHVREDAEHPVLGKGVQEIPTNYFDYLSGTVPFKWSEMRKDQKNDDGSTTPREGSRTRKEAAGPKFQLKRE